MQRCFAFHSLPNASFSARFWRKTVSSFFCRATSAGILLVASVVWGSCAGSAEAAASAARVFCHRHAAVVPNLSVCSCCLFLVGIWCVLRSEQRPHFLASPLIRAPHPLRRWTPRNADRPSSLQLNPVSSRSAGPCRSLRKRTASTPSRRRRNGNKIRNKPCLGAPSWRS